MAVGDRRVAAAAEVPGPQELGGDPGGAPALAAVGGAHDRHPAADIVVGGGHRDQRVAGVVGDRGLVLGQRRVGVVVHLDIRQRRRGRGAAGPQAPGLGGDGGRARHRPHAGRNATREPLGVQHPPWSRPAGRRSGGPTAASMAAIVARANRMTRVRFTDLLLEPKEDRPIAVGVGGARAPASPAPYGLSHGIFARTATRFAPATSLRGRASHPRRFNLRRTVLTASCDATV